MSTTWLSGSSDMNFKDIKYLMKRLPRRTQMAQKVKEKHLV